MTICFFRKKLRALAVDLGTASTLFALPDEGVILREASAAAADRRGNIVALGNDALQHFGRTSDETAVLYPLRGGAVFDASLCRKMLAGFIVRSFGKTARRLGIDAVLCIPASFGAAALRAVKDAAQGAGLRVIRVISAPVAAALGAQLAIAGPEGRMLLDVGGSLACAAVLTCGGIAVQRTVYVGGRHIDHAIVQYMRKTHRVRIGPHTAEDIKFRLASALCTPGRRMQVYGSDIPAALPCAAEADAAGIYRSILPHLNAIAACAAEVLDGTPPELAGDLVGHGVTLAGGGAHLAGLCTLLNRRLRIPAQRAHDPIACAVLGACAAMEDPDRYFLPRKAHNNMAYL